MTNGFEFGVGLVNFALLLFLFKIFMTDPLRVVAQEREEKARRDMEEAEALLLEAKAHLQRYQGLIQNIEEEKKQIELSGLQDAQVARERLAESAQDGARQILERAQLRSLPSAAAPGRAAPWGRPGHRPPRRRPPQKQPGRRSPARHPAESAVQGGIPRCSMRPSQSGIPRPSTRWLARPDRPVSSFVSCSRSWRFSLNTASCATPWSLRRFRATSRRASFVIWRKGGPGPALPLPVVDRAVSLPAGHPAPAERLHSDEGSSKLRWRWPSRWIPRWRSIEPTWRN